MKEDKEYILECVKEFAGKAHEGQTRKYIPIPYIVHPLRVMEMCRKYTGDVCILAAAILHDVLEDTAVTKHQMAAFLDEIMSVKEANKTVELVIELTDVYVKRDYPGLNRRKRKLSELERLVKTSKDSQTIKYADIIDNTKELPMEGENADFSMLFLKECRQLLTKLNKGNAELYKIAVDVVNETLKRLKA